MADPERDDYSEAESFNSGAGRGGSWRGMTLPPGPLQKVMSRFPERETGPNPTEAVGFGESTYGINPSSVRVANSGPAVDNQLAWRLDSGPLYRWERLGPETIFRDGFKNKSDKMFSTVQFYQNNRRDTAFVSSTRERDPEAFKPIWVQDEASFRFSMPNAPGGLDVMATLGVAAYPDQQEVIHYKGVTTLFVGSVDAFSEPDEVNEHGQLIGTADNLLAAPRTREAQRELEQALAPEHVREAAQHAREGRDSEYDRFRQQYAEYYAQSGTHTPHAEVDSNLRAYAEWWSENKSANTEQFRRYSQEWNNRRGPSWNNASPPQPPPGTQSLYDRAREAMESVMGDPDRYKRHQKESQRYEEVLQATDTRRSHEPSIPRSTVGQAVNLYAPPRTEGPEAQGGNTQQGRGVAGPGQSYLPPATPRGDFTPTGPKHGSGH